MYNPSITKHALSVKGHELTVYISQQAGRKIYRTHKCKKCGESLNSSLTFITVVNEIIDSNNQTIDIESELGKSTQRKIRAVMFNDKPLCADCSFEVTTQSE